MNKWIYFLSYIISCGMGTFIVFDFMNTMYSKKFSKIFYPIGMLIYCILWFSISLLQIPFLNFTYLLLSAILVGVLLYRDNNFKKIVQIVYLTLSYAGLDALISLIFPIITNNSILLYSNNYILYFLSVVLVQLAMFIIYKLIIVLLKREITRLFKKQFILLIISSMLNIIIIYIISTVAIKLNYKAIDLILAFMIFISLLLDLFVIYFSGYVSKSIQLEKKVELMQERIDMQYSYYQNLERNYEESQKIMHDIKKHINVINKLYNNEEATEYVEKINAIINNLSLKFRSNNRILNIIINEAIKKGESNGIEFIYSVENINFSFIDDIDITAIFANLLDNAFEACESMDSKYHKMIELRIYKFNNMLIINMINTFQNSIVKKNGLFLSNKRNHKALGLSNVSQAINKYNGDINIDVEEGKFIVSIIFPICN